MSNSHIPVITIDGPTASGKGTVAARVADRLGYHLLDSGALYRLTALSAIRAGVALDDEHAVAKLGAELPATFANGDIFLAGEEVGAAIRAEEVGNSASKIAALPAVRAAAGLPQGARPGSRRARHGNRHLPERPPKSVPDRKCGSTCGTPI